MTFWRRLRTYLVGVGLGLLLVYVIFGDRDLSFWTPQGRVLTAIDSSEQSLSEKAICQMACLNITKADILEIQKTASVDFSESETQKKPCPAYRIYAKLEESDYVLIWQVCENQEKVKLLSIQSLAKDCSC